MDVKSLLYNFEKILKLARLSEFCCDKPEDRMFHASDSTWWMRDGDYWKSADPPKKVADLQNEAEFFRAIAMGQVPRVVPSWIRVRLTVNGDSQQSVNAGEYPSFYDGGVRIKLRSESSLLVPWENFEVLEWTENNPKKCPL